MLENERVPKIPAYASLINGHCVSQALVKVCACFITDTENGPCLIRKMVELYKMLRLQKKKKMSCDVKSTLLEANGQKHPAMSLLIPKKKTR